MQDLNIKLAMLRKEHGYTQEQLSDFLNLTRSAISNYELGLNEPSLDTMVAIASNPHWVYLKGNHEQMFEDAIREYSKN